MKKVKKIYKDLIEYSPNILGVILILFGVVLILGEAGNFNIIGFLGFKAIGLLSFIIGLELLECLGSGNDIDRDLEKWIEKSKPILIGVVLFYIVVATIAII